MLGRILDLEENELDRVEMYKVYGTQDTFWQTFRIWMEKMDSSELTV